MRRIFDRIFVFTALLAFAVPALGQVRTWDGGAAGTGNDVNTAANWSSDTLPVAAGTALFSNLGPLDPTQSAAFLVRNMTFDALAPAYTYNANGFNLSLSGGANSGTIANNSAFTQVINMGGGLLTVGATAGNTNFAANEADIVFNGRITPGGNLNSSSSYLNFTGAPAVSTNPTRDVYINVDSTIHPLGQGNVGGVNDWGATTANSSTRGFTYIETAGRVYMGDIGTAYLGRWVLDGATATGPGGSLRLTHNNSLGGVTSTRVYIGLTASGGGGAATQNTTLEFSNNISVTKFAMFMEPRNGANNSADPHILNVSGNNTFTLTADWNTSSGESGNWNIQSDSGKFTIAGGNFYATGTGNTVLQLRGAGDGQFDCPLVTWTNNSPSIPVVKSGTGTWTFTNIPFADGSSIFASPTANATSVWTGSFTVQARHARTRRIDFALQRHRRRHPRRGHLRCQRPRRRPLPQSRKPDDQRCGHDQRQPDCRDQQHDRPRRQRHRNADDQWCTHTDWRIDAAVQAQQYVHDQWRNQRPHRPDWCQRQPVAGRQHDREHHAHGRQSRQRQLLADQLQRHADRRRDEPESYRFTSLAAADLRRQHGDGRASEPHRHRLRGEPHLGRRRQRRHLGRRPGRPELDQLDRPPDRQPLLQRRQRHLLQHRYDLAVHQRHRLDGHDELHQRRRPELHDQRRHAERSQHELQRRRFRHVHERFHRRLERGQRDRVQQCRSGHRQQLRRHHGLHQRRHRVLHVQQHRSRTHSSFHCRHQQRHPRSPSRRRHHRDEQFHRIGHASQRQHQHRHCQRRQLRLQRHDQRDCRHAENRFHDRDRRTPGHHEHPERSHPRPQRHLVDDWHCADRRHRQRHVARPDFQQQHDRARHHSERDHDRRHDAQQRFGSRLHHRLRRRRQQLPDTAEQ